MNHYVVAWVVVVLAALAASYALHRAVRRLRGVVWRGVVWLAAVWLLLPAPVPGHPGHYAPAFLVFAFEALFQRPGQPEAAGLILAGGTALTLAGMLVAALVARRRAP